MRHSLTPSHCACRARHVSSADKESQSVLKGSHAAFQSQGCTADGDAPAQPHPLHDLHRLRVVPLGVHHIRQMRAPMSEHQRRRLKPVLAAEVGRCRVPRLEREPAVLLPPRVEVGLEVLPRETFPPLLPRLVVALGPRWGAASEPPRGVAARNSAYSYGSVLARCARAGRATWWNFITLRGQSGSPG